MNKDLSLLIIHVLQVSGLQDLIGDNLVIDLSRDLLSVSPSGYVIRTSLSDEGGESQPCVLKRCDVVDQNPPDLARLQHPHVVHLIGFWIEEKYLFLVMEVLDGDLDNLIFRTKSATPLSLHVAVDLMLQIAEACFTCMKWASHIHSSVTMYCSS